ncbi:MAG TPA: tetratricopeptide repeat protein [Candidatus Kryptonia bacterium]|nr:tetratricopeptide repeat protein [Candidatus Kryptonia bacterium]
MSKKPRERFAELAQVPDERIDLAEAALLIAAEAYPDLDINAYLNRLDALAQEARAFLGSASSDVERIERLNQFLFVEKGFVGNQKRYYDRRNSFLNEVLDRHTGIPITLSVVYIEVARRLGLPVQGVGFPGHFLAKYVGDEEIIIDAFFGQVLTERDCRERLQSVLGPEASFDRRYLRSATPREILVRMLGNLKQVHIKAEEFEAALSCCDRILMLTPAAPQEIRDRGLLYQRLECYGAALADLERFLQLAPNDETADTIRENLVTVRRYAAQIH